ncbi:MAG: RNA polymerase sigma factor (sigma-70 family) [Planctomycetota bacterium]|jgi:RNA polymerase sigma factor (sigma-70 family)
MSQHPDYIYIKALAENDTFVINRLYEKFSPKIIAFVRNNSGNESEAQDLFQDALIAIFHKAVEKDFVLSCPFDAYLFMVCRNKWFNLLKSKGKKGVTLVEPNTFNNDKQTVELSEETIVEDEKQKLFDKTLLEISDKCQEMLKLSWAGNSMDKVAELLNVSYGYARKKKSECMKRLTTLIKESSEYKQIKSY